MTDLYQGMGDDLQSPAAHLAAITPSDAADLPLASKGLYVGGAGDITLIAVGDSAAVKLAAVPAGTVLRVRAKRVMSTGTTATNLVAFI